jgi:hypothetical protein
MGQQTTTFISGTQFGHDCLFGADDLERTHVPHSGKANSTATLPMWQFIVDLLLNLIFFFFLLWTLVGIPRRGGVIR